MIPTSDNLGIMIMRFDTNSSYNFIICKCLYLFLSSVSCQIN